MWSRASWELLYWATTQQKRLKLLLIGHSFEIIGVTFDFFFSFLLWITHIFFSAVQATSVLEPAETSDRCQDSRGLCFHGESRHKGCWTYGWECMEAHFCQRTTAGQCRLDLKQHELLSSSPHVSFSPAGTAKQLLHFLWRPEAELVPDVWIRESLIRLLQRGERSVIHLPEPFIIVTHIRYKVHQAAGGMLCIWWWLLLCSSGMFSESEQRGLLGYCGDSGSESRWGPGGGEWRLSGGGVHRLAPAEPRHRTGHTLLLLFNQFHQFPWIFFFFLRWWHTIVEC